MVMRSPVRHDSSSGYTQHQNSVGLQTPGAGVGGGGCTTIYGLHTHIHACFFFIWSLIQLVIVDSTAAPALYIVGQ